MPPAGGVGNQTRSRATPHILHLSTDDARGGAARCAYGVHAGLLRIGHDSRMLVARRRRADPTVHRYEPPAGAIARFRRRCRQLRIDRERAPYRDTRPAGLEPFTSDRTRFGGWLDGNFSSFDVVHLHWVARFVDVPRFLPRLPAGVPLVWTLYDMRALTGGCHYDLGCGRFAERCGRCPQLGSKHERDLSRDIWLRQAGALQDWPRDRLHMVAPSRWMAAEIERSSLFGRRFPVSVVPHGVDVEAFAPRGRAAARDVLGVPPEARVVVFVAHSVDNRRKGFDLLLAALRGLEDVPDLFLIAVGTGRLPPDLVIPHLHTGYVENDRLMSLIYSAADVHALASRQDNLPLTVLEAMACGVPTAGFTVGGVPDMVRPGETGALAPVDDVDGLRAAIRSLLLAPDTERARVAERCRTIATCEYTLEKQAELYAELYRGLVASGAVA